MGCEDCFDDYDEEFSLEHTLKSASMLAQWAPGLAKRQLEIAIKEVGEKPELVERLVEITALLEKDKIAAKKRIDECIVEHRAEIRAAFQKCIRKCLPPRPSD